MAVGIGPGVNKDTLQLIAGDGNPVVQVEDFNQLESMMETIKSSACSGMSKIEQTLNIFCCSLHLISNYEIWKVLIKDVGQLSNMHQKSEGNTNVFATNEISIQCRGKLGLAHERILFMSLILSVTERSDGTTQIHVIYLFWYPDYLRGYYTLSVLMKPFFKKYGAPDVVLS